MDEKSAPVSENLAIELVLKTNQFRKKTQYNEICEDESRTLDHTQLFLKDMNEVFDNSITESGTRLDIAKKKTFSVFH